jgi:gamma-glutamyl-gamma-aminobutyrate hydrolase PuuD
MLEVPSRRFVLGVQWHPERPDVSDAGDRIADALVGAARTRRFALARAA